MAGHANWHEMFERIEFYRIDIQLLRELGHDVVPVGDPRAIDWGADLYYCMWWGHAVFPMIPAKLRRKPIVVTGAFDYATCRDELPGTCYLDRPLWQKAAIRGVLKFADASLFVSKYEYLEVTSNLPVRRPILAQLAVDTQHYTPDPAVARSDYFFALSILTRENAVRKGVTKTIEAMARMRPEHAGTRLVIAGKHGNAHDELWARVKELGLQHRVELPGMISQEQKLRSYRECIAYVQPTLYEGFGHAIAEAVSCGATVIAAPRGAVPEVAGDTAIFIDPSDPAAIAEAMDRCVADPVNDAVRAHRHARIEEHFSLARRREQFRQILAPFELRA